MIGDSLVDATILGSPLRFLPSVGLAVLRGYAFGLLLVAGVLLVRRVA